MQNAYWRTNISGLPFLFLTLEFLPTHNNPAAVTWAQGILDAYPNDLVVIATHSYLWTHNAPPVPTYEVDRHNEFSDGQTLWTQLIEPRPNVWMVLCGHMGSPGNTRFLDPVTKQRATNNYGRSVNELFLDYSWCYAGEPPHCCDPGGLQRLVFGREIFGRGAPDQGRSAQEQRRGQTLVVRV